MAWPRLNTYDVGCRPKTKLCHFSRHERQAVCPLEGMIWTNLVVRRGGSAQFAVEGTQLPLGHIGHSSLGVNIFQVRKELSVCGRRTHVEGDDRVPGNLHILVERRRRVIQQLLICRTAVGINHVYIGTVQTVPPRGVSSAGSVVHRILVGGFLR